MLQNPKHPFQGGRVNTGIDNDATILSDLNYHVAARRRSGRHRIRNDHRRHKTRALPSSAFRLRAERSSPIQQKRARDAVPPRRRRDRPWRLHALQNNLELLVIRPASTSAGLNNSQPFNLSTVLIAVHKDCYTALILTRQGGPHRRETDLCEYKREMELHISDITDATNSKIYTLLIEVAPKHRGLERTSY